MSTTLEEIRKSNANRRAQVFDARVVANYGDPGIDEDYHFDILSRYVIVMLESCYRVPTKDKWGGVFAVVQRPRSLWVSLEGTDTNNPSTQRRSDSLGNVSIGLAGSYSTNGIPRINNPYQLGELIKIKKISQPYRMGVDSMFVSQFFTPLTSQGQYGNWHTEGSSFPYFQNSPARTSNLQNKTLMQATSTGSYSYGMTLFKEHYEAFMLTLAQSTNPELTNGLISIFSDSIGASNAVYSANGGYLFKQVPNVVLYAMEYEDMNVDNKQRVATSECLPLVVATPNSFPTPRTREAGTIAYNPTYSNIIR